MEKWGEEKVIVMDETPDFRKKITNMRKILSYLVLFVMTTLAAYPQSGSALLLNPHGDGNTHWQPNSQYDCGYLKARLFVSSRYYICQYGFIQTCISSRRKKLRCRQ